MGNHNGTLYGNAIITTGNSGMFGEGLSLDGNGDYVRAGNIHQNPARSVTSGTVEMWVKLSSVLVGSWHHIAGTWGSQGIELWVDGDRVATNSYTGSPNANYQTALIGTDSWRWATQGIKEGK